MNIQAPSPSPSGFQKVSGTSNVALSSVTPVSGTNATFAVTTVHIPLEAIGMTFEYQIAGAPNGDYMTMCLNDTNLFTMESDYVEAGGWNGTPMLLVTDYRDHDVDLTFTLNGQGAPSLGSLAVRNIQFYVPQRPALNISVVGRQTTIWWPSSGMDCSVEATSDLSDPNSWLPITTSPSDVDYFHTMSFDATGHRRQFFRLRKSAAP